MTKVWFITGASRGLGRALADAVLSAGHSVVAAVRNPSLFTLKHPRLLVLPLDVTGSDEHDFQSAVKLAVEKFGRIDVLVNNAGYGQLSLFEETDDSAVRAVFETNVLGMMRVTRAVLPIMRQHRNGHIFNISSLAGYVGGAAIYSATKFAVTGFTESLAFELAPFGIKVTNVAPGYFRTDFLNTNSLQNQPSWKIPDYDPLRQQLQAFINQTNHNQSGSPDAFAELLIQVADTEKPPLHLPVGEDAITAIEHHQTSLSQDLSLWRDRAVATAITSSN